MVWGSTHILQQLLFFLLIVTIDFDLTWRSFLIFWGPNGLSLGSMCSWETVLGSIHVVEQLSFSIIPWNPTFEFDLIFFLIFGALMGYFWVAVGFESCFGVYPIVEQLSFSIFCSILLFDIELILGSFFTFSGQDRVEKLFWGLLM